jgi:hypothetical protein
MHKWSQVSHKAPNPLTASDNQPTNRPTYQPLFIIMWEVQFYRLHFCLLQKSETSRSFISFAFMLHAVYSGCRLLHEKTEGQTDIAKRTCAFLQLLFANAL